MSDADKLNEIRAAVESWRMHGLPDDRLEQIEDILDRPAAAPVGPREDYEYEEDFDHPIRNESEWREADVVVEHPPAADGAFLPCRGCAEDAKAARAELDALRAENERLARDLKAMTRDREILYRDNCDGRDALDHYQAANERLQARIRAGLEARTADEMRAELLGMRDTTPPDRSGRFVGDEFHPLTDLDGWQPTNREEPVNGD